MLAFFFRKKIKSRPIWIRFIGIPLISLVMPFIFDGAEHMHGWELLWDFVFAFVMTILIWEGNSLIVRLVRHYLSWERYPAFRIAAQSVLTILFSIGSFLALSNLFHPFLHVQNITEGNKEVTLLSLATVTLMINALYEGLYFSRRWRFSVMRSEVLKRAVLRAQYEGLKNQINPHFLFNSLNTLSGLIDENAGEAIGYVHKLASAYRYLLQNRDTKLVRASLELKFTETYLSLLQTRFGERLKTHFDINPDMLDKRLPPLSLQILVENAVKYNTMSMDKPLLITVELTDSYVTVRNNLQLMDHVEEYTKLGLRNIRDRYTELTRKPVQIKNNGKEFSVSLPLI